MKITLLVIIIITLIISIDMPSKKRGGLSKPEYARAQAAKSAPVVKAKAASRPVSPLVGAGPLMTGQKRVGGTVTGAGPLLPGQNRATDSYTGGGTQKSDASKRREAAKAANIKKSGFDFQSAVDSGGLQVNPNSLPVSQRPTTLKQGGSSFMGDLKNRAIGGFMDLMGGFGKAAYDRGLGQAAPSTFLSEEQRRNNRQAAYDNTIGIPTTNAQTPFDLPMNNDQYQQDLAAAFGPTQNEADLGSALASGGITENIPQDNGRSRLAELFAPSAKAQEDPFGGNRNTGNTNFDNTREVSGIDPTLVDEMGFDQNAYSQQQNELYGGGQRQDAPFGTQGNRSGRGNGMFATGKGLMNDDPYIKELRKAYSSNGGEKWLRKQFDELIKALDPTYAALQKEGTDALQAQLLNNNNQLASVMNANNTGDSEQRAQLMAQQQSQTQNAIGNLLAKLAQNKAQDVSQYKQSYAEKRGQLADRNQSNQQRLLELMRQYQNDQYDQNYKNASLAGRGGTKSYGTTLDKIMAERGVDVTTARAIYAQQNGLRNVPAQQGNTIQELADSLGVDYATAQKMYLAEQGY